MGDCHMAQIMEPEILYIGVSTCCLKGMPYRMDDDPLNLLPLGIQVNTGLGPWTGMRANI